MKKSLLSLVHWFQCSTKQDTQFSFEIMLVFNFCGIKKLHAQARLRNVVANLTECEGALIVRDLDAPP
jgi:hypothetical protein